MSGVLRFGCLVAIACSVFTISIKKAAADPFTCRPNPSAFAVHGLFSPAENGKKLSRLEFQSLPILPSQSALLTKGTELNVVVDGACLADPMRGPRNLDWLRQIQGELRLPKEGNKIRSVRWVLPEDWEFNRLQEVFEEEPCIQLVSPEGHFYTNEVFNDPFIRDQAHLDAIHFQRALPTFFLPLLTRKDMTIAVVDTGVDFSHIELRSNRWVNRGEIPGNGRDDDQNGYVDDVDGYNFASDIGNAAPQGDWPENHHGTHVAGLAAARIDNRTGGVGINGVAKIMSLNVFGMNGYTRSSILENAIRYAADRRVNIINLSLGGREFSRTMRSALEYAVNKGSFIVSAAGNDGIELCDDPTSFDFISPAIYGSSIDGMIVTGSTDAATGRLSSFSNYSSRLVEITAPGALSSDGQLLGLLSTFPSNTYGFLAGTSMSAPVLSGAASLAMTYLKTYGYDASPKRMEQILKAAALKDSRISDSVQEGRKLDLEALANYLKRTYPIRR